MTRTLLLPLLFVAAAHAATPELLPPTGSFAIGRVTYAWRDDARVEVMSPQPAKREVRVHLFYPAAKRGVKPAPYWPDVDVVERRSGDFLREDFGSSYPLLRTIRTHSYEGVPVAKSPRRFPVVVFSHGGGINVLHYTTLIEDLASHGYIVAAVEHPYDAGFVVFPGNRIIEQAGWGDDAKRSPTERAAFHRGRHLVDAQDNSFVLDQLARIDAGKIASPLKGRIDVSRAVAIGHSLGGKASVMSCAIDARWNRCVNLDGGLDAGERYPRIDKPLLAIYGAPSPVQLPIETEEQFRARRARNATFLESASNRELIAEYENVVAPGTIAYVSSPGFSHFAYYDLVQPEAEPWGATPERNARNLAIVRAAILAFLNGERLARPELTLVPIGKR